MELSLTEKLAFATIRLECTGPNGIHTGTGFIYRISRRGTEAIDVIITNKHVACNATSATFVMTKQSKEEFPCYNEHHETIIENLHSHLYLHPENNVDLCCLPLALVVNQALKDGIKIFYTYFEESHIPNSEQQKELDALEEIIMIGYPNGIWDSFNNQPLFRRGITATHPNLDYNGKKEFIIDAACFPGSSGSPVLLYNSTGFIQKNGGFVGGTRLFLLGILYAGPIHDVTGEIRIVDIPMLKQPTVFSRIPNNLGFVIKSERILELKPLLKESFS